jgi:peptidoglycan/xylan/chitin deacetylase (PgdA/CDA1 family)
VRVPHPTIGARRVLIIVAVALACTTVALATALSLGGCAASPVPDVAPRASAAATLVPEAAATTAPQAVSGVTTGTAAAAGMPPASAKTSDSGDTLRAEMSAMRQPRAARPKVTPAARIDPSPWIGRPLRRAPWPTRKVAITLDDGPSPNTAQVLAIFRKHGLRGTFFFVGDRCQRYRKVVRLAFDAGFEIGDHTLDHQEIFRQSARFDLREIDLGAAELVRETGVRPIYMRPPSGHWDATTLRSIAQRHMIMALWSVHGQDTGPGTHASVIARHAVANARGGDIILLHETNPETVKALPAILEGLVRKGLRPVTLSELMTR